MSIESIQYETFIIIGVIFLLFFSYSIYIANMIIKKIKTMGEIKKTNNCLMTTTDDRKITYKVEEEDEIHALIYDIKNKISILKEEVNLSAYSIKNNIPQYHEYRENRDEKTEMIIGLQQRLQEIEHKYKRVLLLHKTITEKEKIKDTMVAEKERYIYMLQQQLSDSQKKIEHMMMSNEENKEKLIDRKFVDLEKQIQTEKDKNQIYAILVILGILILYIWSIS